VAFSTSLGSVCFFFDPGSAAADLVTQEIEFCSADAASAFDDDFLEAWERKRENLFYSDIIAGNFADSEAATGELTTGSDDDTFKNLSPFFVALADFLMDSDSITHTNVLILEFEMLHTLLFLCFLLIIS